MTESELRELFRRALKASLAVPLLAGVTGVTSCSSSSTPARADGGGSPDTGATTASGKPRDAAADARRDVAASSSGSLAGATGASSGAADAGVDATVHADSGTDAGHPTDARGPDAHDGGRSDAAKHDAAKDAATDAKPDTYVNCNVSQVPPGVLYLPAACVEGGVPDSASFNCLAYCPGGGYDGTYCYCAFDPSDGGPTVLMCETPALCNGRAYAGMARPTAPGQTSPVGAFFAETAQMEAASVDAFRILRDELRAHDAPLDLTRAAEAAARDEVRHARVTRRLARRYGPCPPHRRAGVRAVRPLEAVAEENAVEGCVRETYAALLAHHQALVATDPEVRDAFAVIAEDETRHAALAWRVAAWADGQLDPRARGRVAAARARAVRELRGALGQAVPPPVTEVAGVPAADNATGMLAVLEAELWAS